MASVLMAISALAFGFWAGWRHGESFGYERACLTMYVGSRCSGCGRLLPPYDGSESPENLADQRAWVDAYAKRAGAAFDRRRDG